MLISLKKPSLLARSLKYRMITLNFLGMAINIFANQFITTFYHEFTVQSYQNAQLYDTLLGFFITNTHFYRFHIKDCQKHDYFVH